MGTNGESALELLPEAPFNCGPSAKDPAILSREMSGLLNWLKGTREAEAATSGTHPDHGSTPSRAQRNMSSSCPAT